MSSKLFSLEELTAPAVVITVQVAEPSAPEVVVDPQASEAVTPEPEAEDLPVEFGVDEEYARIDDYQDRVDEAVDVAGSLGRIRESLSRLTPEEAIPGPAMEALNIAVSGLLGSIGMSEKQQVVAMESFVVAPNATAAMESIAETAKKIWEKIKAFLAKILAAAKAMYERLTGAAGKLVNTGKHMQQRAKDIAAGKKSFTLSTIKLADLGLQDATSTKELYDGFCAAIDDVDKSFFPKAFVIIDFKDILPNDINDPEQVKQATQKLASANEAAFNVIGHGAKKSTDRDGNRQAKVKITGDIYIDVTLKTGAPSRMSFVNVSEATHAGGNRTFSQFNEIQIHELGAKFERLGEHLQRAVSNANELELKYIMANSEGMKKFTGDGGSEEAQNVYNFLVSARFAAILSADVLRAIARCGWSVMDVIRPALVSGAPAKD
jgi:hypothetical protein